MKTILAAIFASLWLLDTAATVSFVAAHGPELEVNPFMRALIEWAGLGAFAMTKAGILAFWLSLQQRAHIWLHVALVLVMAPIAYMGVTVAWGTV